MQGVTARLTFRLDRLCAGLGLSRQLWPGNKKHDYRIDSIAKLTCQNNKLSLQKPLVIPVSWNREQGACGVSKHYAGILDGFIDNNQAYYLAKLQQKYPTCAALEKTFATVK